MNSERPTACVLRAFTVLQTCKWGLLGTKLRRYTCLGVLLIIKELSNACQSRQNLSSAMPSEVGREETRTVPSSMPMRLGTSALSVAEEFPASNQADDATDQYHVSSAHRPEYKEIQSSDRRSIQYRSENVFDTVQNDNHALSPSGKSSSLTHVHRSGDLNPMDLDAVYDKFFKLQIL